MRTNWSPFRLPPRWRRLVFPFLGLSGGGTVAGALLLEEPLVMAGEVCLPLAALPGLYAIAYGFYHHVFKAHIPSHRTSQHLSTKKD